MWQLIGEASDWKEEEEGAVGLVLGQTQATGTCER